jgi:23S rRNA (adenine2030-N6)-methyltransferase
LLWYPIKDTREAESFARRVARLRIPKILRVELAIGTPAANQALVACGILAVNPPWTLERDLVTLLPPLARALGRDGAGSHRLEWITP